jgi:hypothetical protein
MASFPQFERKGIRPNTALPADFGEWDNGSGGCEESGTNEVIDAEYVDVEAEVSSVRVESVSTEKRRTASTAHEMNRYRTLVARAVDVFGNEVKASRWLSLPNQDFNGQTPLQVAQKSGYDLQAIEPILVRIEHGVYY